jgi:hypothetical protein
VARVLRLMLPGLLLLLPLLLRVPLPSPVGTR